MDPFLPAVGELSGRITPSFSSFLSSTLTEVIPATYVTVRGPAAYEFGQLRQSFSETPGCFDPRTGGSSRRRLSTERTQDHDGR